VVVVILRFTMNDVISLPEERLQIKPPRRYTNRLNHWHDPPQVEAFSSKNSPHQASTEACLQGDVV
jgi:hypothetical protein